MAWDANRRVVRRRLGLVLGGSGLALLFGSGASLLSLPTAFAAPALALMVVGLGLLVAGFLALPRAT